MKALASAFATLALTSMGGLALAQPNPADPALQLWLRADAAVTTDGANGVSVWGDQSGKGAALRNATQATASSRPLRVANGLNGLPVLRFDGANDYLTEPVPLSGPMSVFIVYQPDIAPGTSGSLATLKGQTGLFSEWAVTNGIGGYTSNGFLHDYVNPGGDGASVGLNQPYDANPHVFSVTYNGGTNSNPASYTGARDGVGTVVPSGNFGRLPNDIGAIGGRPVQGIAFFTGDIAEFIVYNTVLDAAQRQGIGAYLAQKYAIASADTPLPVELQSVIGQSRDGSVELSWRTATERDNAGFTLLRDGQSLASYRTAPGLIGGGTTTTTRLYRYTDQTVQVGRTYRYALGSIDLTGMVHQYPQSVLVTVEGRAETSPFATPTEFRLVGASPNPFNPSTSLRFDLPEAATVSVQVYNGLGQLVASPVQGIAYEAGAGSSATVDGSALASGVYLVRFSAAGTSGRVYTASRRVLLAR